MGKTTGIEWTDHTLNFWMGCRHASPGCDNCYMFRERKRYGWNPEHVTRTKTATWKQAEHWNREAEREGKKHLVFTCSWSDFFLKEADIWRPDVWKVIKETPWLIYQILTKRHGRIKHSLPPDWGAGYPNVWLGVSVENQETADQRIPVLLQTPAAVRFLSCEPLLGPVDLQMLHYQGVTNINCLSGQYGVSIPFQGKCCAVDWVIVGGESGPNARPMDDAWVRSIRDQCQAASVPFFYKQRKDGKQLVSLPLLDGVRHAAFPVGRTEAV